MSKERAIKYQDQTIYVGKTYEDCQRQARKSGQHSACEEFVKGHIGQGGNFLKEMI